jgi:putative transposase
MIRKKKKKDFLDINKNIYDINENIINNEYNLIKISNITYYDINFFKSSNYDYIFNNFDIHSKKSFTILNKYLTVLHDDKYHFIKNIKDTFNIVKQLNYFYNKYDNFMKLQSNNDNNINNNGIITINEFIMLVKDNNCIPFWNDDIKQFSNKIFMPIQQNLEKIDPFETFNYKNWFKTEHFINCSDNNYKSLVVDKIRNFVKQFKNKKTGKIENIIKSNKIKLYFNSNQKSFIKRLYGAYRYFYNRTISYINNYNKLTKSTFYHIKYNDESTKININLKEIKNPFTFYTIRDLIKNNYPSWLKEFNVPSHLIDKAINEATDNYDKCLQKINKKQIFYFKLEHKTKKDKMQTMNIELSMIHSQTNSLFYNLSENSKNKYVFRNIKSSCKFSKYKNICDSSITYNQRLNEFYLNINYEDVKLPNKEILNNKKIGSIDPGIKTFTTIYSDNSIDKIGIGIREKIEKICRDIDILTSKQNKKDDKKYKYNYQKRRSLRKALHRKIKYLDNLKTEMHNKTIKFLCDNYGKIIIPPFETQKMVSESKIDNRTSRSLMNLSYYKFLRKLKNRCKEYDIELAIRPEYYTSKTCTRCGNIKKDLKNADIYKCNICNLHIDRDTNGARNIMLRNI